jgi:predicted RNase H-like HicB family nuclease
VTAAEEALAPIAKHGQASRMRVEVEREEDGRWIAEVPTLPGAMAYGASKEEAVAKVEALVLRVLADKLEQGENAPEISRVFTVAA